MLLLRLAKIATIMKSLVALYTIFNRWYIILHDGHKGTPWIGYIQTQSHQRAKYPFISCFLSRTLSRTPKRVGPLMLLVREKLGFMVEILLTGPCCQKKQSIVKLNLKRRDRYTMLLRFLSVSSTVCFPLSNNGAEFSAFIIPQKIAHLFRSIFYV